MKHQISVPFYSKKHLINVVLFEYKDLIHTFDDATGKLVLMYKKMRREYNWEELLSGDYVRPYGKLLDEADAFIDFVDANPEIIHRYENLKKIYGEKL